MAPAEKLPLSEMKVGEVRTFGLDAGDFLNFHKLREHVAYRTSYLRKNTRTDYSYISLPDREQVVVKRVK